MLIIRFQVPDEVHRFLDTEAEVEEDRRRADSDEDEDEDFGSAFVQCYIFLLYLSSCVIGFIDDICERLEFETIRTIDDA